MLSSNVSASMFHTRPLSFMHIELLLPLLMCLRTRSLTKKHVLRMDWLRVSCASTTLIFGGSLHFLSRMVTSFQVRASSAWTVSIWPWLAGKRCLRHGCFCHQ
ncbi:unnamed protein product [Prorocentrum cordatum]|uniref:Uncharacterized protein n=1 Tax=Prorocentrum cordatum TaxID=2364126 RepID=A0ABN9VDU0_9DINO|nr:unnamed protein product [Polarella glacialis]